MLNSLFAAPSKARPLAPLAVLLILAATAHALLVGCGGRGQERNSNPEPSEAPVAQPAADTGGAGSGGLALGSKVYAERCALCHGPEGKGDGPAAAALNPKPRNHTDGAYMNGRTDEDLLQVIRGGKGAMPAWGNVLSEQEIQAVLRYVRSLAR